MVYQIPVQEQIFNTPTNAGQTPATDSGSGWGKTAQSFIEQLTKTGLDLITAKQVSKYRENVLDAQAAANKALVVNPAFANQQAQPVLGPTTDYKKLLTTGLLVAGVLVGGVLIVKALKK